MNTKLKRRPHTMRVSELKAWLRRSFELTRAKWDRSRPSRRYYDCFIAGPPGSGKSSAVMQAVKEAAADLLVIIAVTASPTDARGFPSPNKQRTAADFLPYGDIQTMMSATSLLVVFLDDFGQAKDAVQASYMQLVLTREINGFKIPDCVVFVLATNRREDRAAVRGILEPMKSRPLTILELEPDHEEWCQYMLRTEPKSQHLSDVVGFIRYLPKYFLKFVPTADMVNSPLPRTWDNVLGILVDYTDAPGISPQMIDNGILGAVGSEAQKLLQGYLRIRSELPDIPSLINDAAARADFDIANASPSAMYAIVTAMAMHTTAHNFHGVGHFAQLLHEANRDEYAACLLRDCMLDEAVCMSPAFASIVTGELATLVGISNTNGGN